MPLKQGALDRQRVRCCAHWNVIGKSDMLIDEHWHGIKSAPNDRDLELAVIEHNVAHALVFPCRRGPEGWIHAQTKAVIKVMPTHWRFWQD